MTPDEMEDILALFKLLEGEEMWSTISEVRLYLGGSHSDYYLTENGVECRVSRPTEGTVYGNA